ncbi:MAG: hypothetical protein JWM82_1902 [Myxococcales bacterium]|nr:hypothetical protein [Myxococcales bacterium]
MACAFDGPIPGNNASTSAGAVLRLMAPSTAFPAPAGRPTKTLKATETIRNAARTAIVVVRPCQRLRATYGASALGAQTLATAVGLCASSIMPGDWATDIIVVVEIPVEATG